MLSSLPPVVLHIPHSSQVVPPDIRSSYDVSPETLARELLRMTDHFTDELFRLPPAVATSIAFRVSRLVVDPERFVDDDQEPMSAKGMGVVYTRTSDGQRLRPDPLPAAGQPVAIGGKTYTPDELKKIADQVIETRKGYSTQIAGFEQSQVELKKVIVMLEKNQRECQAQISRLEGQIAQIDVRIFQGSIKWPH